MAATRRAVSIGSVAAAILLAGCGGTTASDASTTTTEPLPRVVTLSLSDTDDPPRYRYVIPEGTAADLDAGREVRLLPPELVVLRGDVIRIDNRDVRPHFVGPFYIPPGHVLQQRFDSLGRYIGFCSVYPSGQVIIEVRERPAP